MSTKMATNDRFRRHIWVTLEYPDTARQQLFLLLQFLSSTGNSLSNLSVLFTLQIYNSMTAVLINLRPDYFLSYVPQNSQYFHQDFFTIHNVQFFVYHVQAHVQSCIEWKESLSQAVTAKKVRGGYKIPSCQFHFHLFTQQICCRVRLTKIVGWVGGTEPGIDL